MYVAMRNKAFKRAIANAIIMIVAYAITWRFYAMWWFFIAFLDLIALLFCIIGLISSIVFGIKNRKSGSQPFVPFFINIAAVVLLLLAPSTYRNKSYFKSTYELNDCKAKNKTQLYIETYCVYGGGALSTDLNSLYLTDSLNFRQYLGTYDEGEEGIHTLCAGDSIIVEKSAISNSPWFGPKLLDRKIYSLVYLKYHYGYN